MFSFMNRLQYRIFAFFVLLLIGVQAVSFWMSYSANKRLERQQLHNQVSVAQKVFRAEYDSRNYYLGAFAETAAKDFGLKDVFIDGDSRSFLVALNNHRKRIDADMAMAISREGKIIGQLLKHKDEIGQDRVRLGGEQGHEFRYRLDTELEQISPLYAQGDDIYQIRFAPLGSGGDTIIGWVGFGYVIDESLATQLQDKTGLNTGFALETTAGKLAFVANSAPALTTQMSEVLREYVSRGTQHPDYLLWRQLLGDVDGQPLSAYMYLPRAAALQTLQKQWWQQLALLLSLLPISLLLAFFISGSVTRPIEQLIEQAKFIAKGNYDSSVSVGTSVEMVQLAKEFTLMQQAILSREKKIAHQVFHDPLTNLPNRNELERVLSSWLKDKATAAIFLLNIRRLTEVNVTLGHVVGDEVIREVGRRLSAMNDIDLVCRLSADEYVLAFRHFVPAQLPPFISQLQAHMDKRYWYEDISLHLQLTLGVSFTQPGMDLTTLLRQADTALHHARTEKLDYQVYDQQIDKHTVERLKLVNELKAAILNQELVLFYQPKLSLASGKVTQVEALVRWQHPQKGMIPPDVFIPIAEKTGQMNTLSRWVLNEAIAQYHRWQAEGISLGIAVNISAENLKDPDFCRWVLETIGVHKMPTQALTLEITEDALVADPQKAIAFLGMWRDHGLKLSIDDYGTGYSSLGQLKQLPVHELKLDKSFIQQLMTDDDDRIIVSSTLSLAHNLGLTVVAEGIEDAQTLEWLTAQGCEMGQGFYMSRPLAAANFSLWLRQSNYFQQAAQGG